MALPGSEKHMARLRRMQADAPRSVAGALYRAGQMIELEAERSITAGSVSGKGHVPSAPGQPPNRDTGRLDGAIDTVLIAQSPPTVEVTSRAPYSAALEYGTSKMAERPFMRPAALKSRDDVTRLVQEAVNITIK